MEIKKWKKWLSHLRPLTLEQSGSDLNPELSVVLDRGRLQLLSGNAIYSWDDLYRNFVVAFRQFDFEKNKVENVLLLGLGLASVPFILEKMFEKKLHYTAIELDEEVIHLAMKYAIPRLKSPIEVVTADAEVFVEVCEETFDMVIVDIFEDDITPPQFETPEFLERCADLLNPGGTLLFNRLHHTVADRAATERFFKNTFLKSFPDAEKVDSEGNWVLVFRKPKTA